MVRELKSVFSQESKITLSVLANHSRASGDLLDLTHLNSMSANTKKWLRRSLEFYLESYSSISPIFTLQPRDAFLVIVGPSWVHWAVVGAFMHRNRPNRYWQTRIYYCRWCGTRGSRTRDGQRAEIGVFQKLEYFRIDPGWPTKWFRWLAVPQAAQLNSIKDEKMCA
jgi:hypothetical protein